ncbi:MAG: acetyl-CoA carboxylase biotin carboxyl carrier protein [Endomicrobiales bacterium]|nr:acetyl-CoA carboxylase biotin carboxyl carrier protein [Endomicrobiales bacterium]
MNEKNSKKNEKSVHKHVKDLYDLMKSENLEEIEIKNKDLYLHLKRKGKNVKNNPVNYQNVVLPVLNGNGVNNNSNNVSNSKPEVKGETIKSPIIGTFYRAPSPASPAFIQEGDTVSPGKTLCIVEAMKVMNEIKAENSVKILKILVENGKPVTSDQDLFLIEKL